jgi:hypothetical protein
MKVYLLDLWALPNDTPRLVARASGDFNRFTLVSMGTGEAPNVMTGPTLCAYLAGKNPHKTPFEYRGNIAEPGFASIIVPEED